MPSAELEPALRGRRSPRGQIPAPALLPGREPALRDGRRMRPSLAIRKRACHRHVTPIKQFLADAEPADCSGGCLTFCLAVRE